MKDRTVFIFATAFAWVAAVALSGFFEQQAIFYADSSALTGGEDARMAAIGNGVLYGLTPIIFLLSTFFSRGCERIDTLFPTAKNAGLNLLSYAPLYVLVYYWVYCTIDIGIRESGIAMLCDCIAAFALFSGAAFIVLCWRAAWVVRKKDIPLPDTTHITT